MTERIFKSNLIVNWRDGKMRCVTKRPKNLKGTELAIDFTLTIDIPETPEYKAEGKITINPIQMSAITLENIEDESQGE